MFKKLRFTFLTIITFGLLFLIGSLSVKGFDLDIHTLNIESFEVTTDGQFNKLEDAALVDQIESFYGDTNMLLTDDSAEYEFSYYEEKGIFLSANPEYQFRVTEDHQFTAYFRVSGMAHVVILDSNNKVLGHKILAKGSMLFETDLESFKNDLSIKPGYTFSKWSYDFTQVVNQGVTFIKAIYNAKETLFDVTVDIGTINVEQVLYGKTITVEAPETKDELFFSHWTINGTIASYKRIFTFSVYEDCTVKAIYSETQPDINTFSYLSKNVIDFENKKIFIAQSYTNQKILERGMIFLESDDEVTDIDFGSVGVTRVRALRVTNNGEFAITNTFDKTKHLYVKSYIVLEVGESEYQTIFSDILKVEKEDIIEEATYTETFETAGLTASYLADSFIGINGVEWTYNDARNEGDYPIENDGILFRGDAGFISAQIAGGVSNFSFQYRKAFTGKSNRKIKLIITDSLGNEYNAETENFGAFSGEDTSIYTLTINNLNIVGTFFVKISNMGAQVTVDNITWTTYTLSLEQVKVDSKIELQNYVDLNNYSNVQKNNINDIILSHINLIDNAGNVDEVIAHLNNGKNILDKVVTKNNEYDSAKANINLPNGDIATNIDLGTSPESYITYVWRFNPEGIFDPLTGTFNEPSVDTVVNIEVDILIDGIKFGDTLTSSVTAKAKLTDEQLYDHGKSYIIEETGILDGILVEEDLLLPTKHPGFDNLTFVWSSDKPNYISDNGTYVAPKTDTEVTLTVFIQIDGITYEPALTFTVLAKAAKPVIIIDQDLLKTTNNPPADWNYNVGSEYKDGSLKLDGTGKYVITSSFNLSNESDLAVVCKANGGPSFKGSIRLIGIYSDKSTVVLDTAEFIFGTSIEFVYNYNIKDLNVVRIKIEFVKDVGNLGLYSVKLVQNAFT